MAYQIARSNIDRLVCERPNRRGVNRHDTVQFTQIAWEVSFSPAQLAQALCFYYIRASEISTQVVDHGLDVGRNPVLIDRRFECLERELREILGCPR